MGDTGGRHRVTFGRPPRPSNRAAVQRGAGQPTGAWSRSRSPDNERYPPVGDPRQCAIPKKEQNPTLSDIGEIAAGRLDAAQLAANFADAHPPLSPAQAVVEANRCYFCYDAPCVAACPTGIDIPSFIRKIATGNVRGSAQTILEANILGGSCARVSPTEELCERAFVHTAHGSKPM